MCVGVRGESKNTKSGLCVPRARPDPHLQERQKKWRRPLLPQTAAQRAWVSKAISETLKAALKGRLKKQLSPHLGMACPDQSAQYSRWPRSHSQTLPHSPGSSEGIVQKLVQLASWDKRLVSHLLWDFRVASLEGSSFS